MGGTLCHEAKSQPSAAFSCLALTLTLDSAAQHCTLYNPCTVYTTFVQCDLYKRAWLTQHNTVCTTAVSLCLHHVACCTLYPVFNCASLLSTEVFRKHSEMFDWFGELYHCLLQSRSLIFWTNQNRREFKVLLFTTSWMEISLHCRGDQKNEKKGNINSLKMKKMESKDK